MKNIAQLILAGIQASGFSADSLGLNKERTRMTVSFYSAKSAQNFAKAYGSQVEQGERGCKVTVDL